MSETPQEPIEQAGPHQPGETGEDQPDRQRERRARGAPDEATSRVIAEALGVYSADGQVDDATGGDAGAEQEYGHEARAEAEESSGQRWSPDGRPGPA